MDIRCPTCGEPYDQYHMRHDEIWETDLPEGIKRRLSDKGTPLDQYDARKHLEDLGWQFAGNSVLTFVRCPCCPNEASPDLEEAEKRAVISDLLGDDEDGMAAMLEDLGM